MIDIVELSHRRWILHFSLLCCLFACLSVQAETGSGKTHTGYIATFEISPNDAEAITFNAGDNCIWIYGKQRLQAFHPDGRRKVDQKLPELPANQSAVEMLTQDHRLWLAIGRVLYEFDDKGKMVKRRGFNDTIAAIHYDVMQSQLLVVTADYVVVLDEQGKEIERIRTRFANIA